MSKKTGRGGGHQKREKEERKKEKKKGRGASTAITVNAPTIYNGCTGSLLLLLFKRVISFFLSSQVENATERVGHIPYNIKDQKKYI
jgi:hypothetical protein